MTTVGPYKGGHINRVSMVSELHKLYGSNWFTIHMSKFTMMRRAKTILFYLYGSLLYAGTSRGGGGGGNFVHLVCVADTTCNLVRWQNTVCISGKAGKRVTNAPKVPLIVLQLVCHHA